jgi:hypothetical protein
MKRDLVLASPNVRGPDVAYAQRLLAGSAYGFGVQVGREGVYDVKTAAATKRAKFLLGYPTDKINETFGDTLELFLRREAPSKKLPLLYRQRRRNRVAAIAASKDVGLAALAEAKRWLGTKETPPNSNVAKPFGPWYNGYVGPWCAVFVSYCLEKAGFKHTDPGSARWAYCPYMVNDARAQRNGLRAIPASAVEPGDIVLYDWDGGVADHVGFFEEWIVRGSTFHAIEGNTAVGNDSNGGEVMRRVRSVSQVEQFAQVSQ